jgi:hypothetical protein
MVSPYIAQWPGLLGVLTEGDISTIPTWTGDDLLLAFVRVDIDCHYHIIQALLRPDVTVFDLKAAIMMANIGDDGIWKQLHYVQFEYEHELGSFLGLDTNVHNWCTRYLLDDVERSDIQNSVNWIRVIRVAERPDIWNDSDVDAMLSKLSFKNTDDIVEDPKSEEDHVFSNFFHTTVRQCDVEALVSAMETMTKAQRLRCAPHIEFAMATILKDLYDHPELRKPYDGILAKLEWDREKVINVYKYAATHWAIWLSMPHEGMKCHFLEHKSFMYDDLRKAKDNQSRASFLLDFYQRHPLAGMSTFETIESLTVTIEYMNLNFYQNYYNAMVDVEYLPLR